MTATGAETAKASMDTQELEALRPTLTRVARVAKALFNAPAADVCVFVGAQIWRASDAEGALQETDPASEYTTHGDNVLWVRDLREDPRFKDHPTVAGERLLRFYAGAPIIVEGGKHVGALAVYDQAPRELDAKLAARLQDLAGVVAHDFDRVRAVRERAEAMEQMARSEERFRIAIEGAGLHVYEMDYKARTLMKAGAEDSFFETPRSYDDLIKNSWAGVHPDDLPQAQADWARAEKAGEPWIGDYRVPRSDGKLIWATHNARTFADEKGRVHRLVGSMQNITARKEAEAAVREAQAQAESNAARLSFALDAAKSAAWEIDTVSGTLVGGDELGAICGRTIKLEDVLKLTEAIVHTEDRPKLRDFVFALADGARHDIEHRIVRADRSVGWVHTSGRAVSVGDEHGRRVILLTTDITERRKLEAEFAEAMHQAALSLESKRSLLEAIARDIGQSPSAQRATPSAPAPEKPAEGDGFNGLYTRLAALLSEIETRDSALVEAVDALRESRRAADAANVAKSQFLATMSHELRTPLNAVIGYAEILEEDLSSSGDNAGASDAGRIHRAARDLLGLINEVLDFSKIEAGRMEIRYAHAHVPTLIAETVETTRHIAEANNNKLHVRMPADLDDVFTDPARLRQCLLNLVSNACKFTSDGEISIDARIEDAKLVIDVADTGVGIAPEEATRLFQPFVQADGSFTRKQGGTGLGLVITRKLAQLMGGDVSFVSEPGRGSTFTLRVSAAPEDAEATDTGEGPVILAIEDDRSARDLIRRSLSHLPFRLRFANNADHGMALAREQVPALIVLDIHLPDRSGWDLLREMKNDAALKGVPVLVASIDDDRARALSLGACEHLVKPLDREVFAASAMRYAQISASKSAVA